MSNLTLISAGARLKFNNPGWDPRGVELIGLGMPHDHRPGPAPGTHGEPLGLENFYTRGILQAEELCGGGLVVMRVAFKPRHIAIIDHLSNKIPGYKIPATMSWRLGNTKTEVADVFRLDRGYAEKFGLRGVGFLAADSGLCQIVVFRDGLWLCSYFIHIGFFNLAPKDDPRGMSLVGAVVADIQKKNWEEKFDDKVVVRAYYGMGICPEWYGVGPDYVKHVTARYGDEAEVMLRKPSAGPRSGNDHSISLQAMLDAEFDRSGIKEHCAFEQMSFEGTETCPAAMCNAEGKPILWSDVRDGGVKPDKPLPPRNLIFFTLPQ